MRNDDYMLASLRPLYPDLDRSMREKEDFEEWNQRILGALAPKEDDHLPATETIFVETIDNFEGCPVSDCPVCAGFTLPNGISAFESKRSHHEAINKA